MSATDDYLDAISHGDRAGALTLVRGLLDGGTGPRELMSQVIAPAQQEVGRLWVEDAWSVAREHAATAVSEAVLGLLAAEITTPAAPGPSVLVACTENEWHALPALMVAEHLRADGFSVDYVGANASASGLVRHIHETAPRAVALSCSLSSSLPRLRRQVEAVRSTGTPVLVGGSAFDAGGRRADLLGATAHCSDAERAAKAVDALPEAVPPAPPLLHEGADEGAVLYADREHLALRLSWGWQAGHHAVVAAGSHEAGAGSASWDLALADHVPQVIGSVAAALLTADPLVLADELAWLDEVLRHRGAPPGTVSTLVAELGRVLVPYPVAARLLREVTPAH